MSFAQLLLSPWQDYSATRQSAVLCLYMLGIGIFAAYSMYL